MKKTVKIIGIEMRQGISKKSNEPYKLYILHGTYENDRVSGTGAWSGVVPEAYATRTNLGDDVVIESMFLHGKEIITSFLLPEWQ